MVRTRFIMIASITALLLIGVIYTSIISDHYMLLSFTFAVLACLPFFLRLEQRHVQARELVLLALLAALAAFSRVPFAGIPSVQPTTFVVIITGLVFGAERGFLVGALAALVSNMMLGQGPWTPWQMFSWGMIGFTAGLLANAWWMRRLWGKLAFGIAWGFLFGWIMNVNSVLFFFATFSWPQVGAIYAASFYFDLMHALANVVFLSLFSTSWIKMLQRYKTKYGL